MTEKQKQSYRQALQDLAGRLRCEVSGLRESAMRGVGGEALQKPSPWIAQISVILAAALEVFLIAARLQSDTGDTTARSLLK